MLGKYPSCYSRERWERTLEETPSGHLWSDVERWEAGNRSGSPAATSSFVAQGHIPSWLPAPRPRGQWGRITLAVFPVAENWTGLVGNPYPAQSMGHKPQRAGLVIKAMQCRPGSWYESRSYINWWHSALTIPPTPKFPGVTDWRIPEDSAMKSGWGWGGTEKTRGGG